MALRKLGRGAQTTTRHRGAIEDRLARLALHSSVLRQTRKSPRRAYISDHGTLSVARDVIVDLSGRNIPPLVIVANDGLPLPLSDLYYTNGVYTPDRETTDFSQLRGCSCVTECRPASCWCATRQERRFQGGSAPDFVYTADGKLRSGIPDGIPIYECNAFCGCPDTCTNRVGLPLLFSIPRAFTVRSRSSSEDVNTRSRSSPPGRSKEMASLRSGAGSPRARISARLRESCSPWRMPNVVRSQCTLISRSSPSAHSFKRHSRRRAYLSVQTRLLVHRQTQGRTPNGQHARGPVRPRRERGRQRERSRQLHSSALLTGHSLLGFW